MFVTPVVPSRARLAGGGRRRAGGGGRGKGEEGEREGEGGGGASLESWLQEIIHLEDSDEEEGEGEEEGETEEAKAAAAVNAAMHAAGVLEEYQQTDGRTDLAAMPVPSLKASPGTLVPGGHGRGPRRPAMVSIRDEEDGDDDDVEEVRVDEDVAEVLGVRTGKRKLGDRAGKGKVEEKVRNGKLGAEKRKRGSVTIGADGSDRDDDDDDDDVVLVAADGQPVKERRGGGHAQNEGRVGKALKSGGERRSQRLQLSPEMGSESKERKENGGGAGAGGNGILGGRNRGVKRRADGVESEREVEVRKRRKGEPEVKDTQVDERAARQSARQEGRKVRHGPIP